MSEPGRHLPHTFPAWLIFQVSLVLLLFLKIVASTISCMVSFDRLCHCCKALSYEEPSGLAALFLRVTEEQHSFWDLNG